MHLSLLIEDYDGHHSNTSQKMLGLCIGYIFVDTEERFILSFVTIEIQSELLHF